MMDWSKFDIILSHTRAYFVMEYHAGTREMIYRFVVSKMGDVEPKLVSAALAILKKNGTIIHDKKVWWFLADK